MDGHQLNGAGFVMLSKSEQNDLKSASSDTYFAIELRTWVQAGEDRKEWLPGEVGGTLEALAEYVEQNQCNGGFCIHSDGRLTYYTEAQLNKFYSDTSEGYYDSRFVTCREDQPGRVTP